MLWSFRGNAEGEIRRNLIRRAYIKDIVGLPANLFYGTGNPLRVTFPEHPTCYGKLVA